MRSSCPLLIAQKPAGVPPVDVRSLHFLAPAITTDLFKERLKKLIGPGQPITRLTTYTMNDELEQTDCVAQAVRQVAAVSGQQRVRGCGPDTHPRDAESLKSDLQLIRFFGLAGTEKVADIVFAKTTATGPLDARTQSISHGGFDNDVATMTSVIRRVLDVPDATPVTDYFEETVPGFARAAVGMARSGRPAATTRTAAASAARAGAAPAGPATARKAWTVMVWMAGDNDLESFGDKDLAEMKRVGSTEQVNVVVQFDSMRDDRTRRYAVTKGGDADADIVQELGETNTGDPLVAIDFFQWAIERYPAERLLGVIWNHGSGIDDTDIYAGAAPRGAAGGRGAAPGPDGRERSLARRALSSRHRRAIFSTTIAQATHDRAIAFDDTSRDFLDNVELKKVLAQVKRQTGRTFDVLGFDACLMNMIEVAYQLKGTTQVVVGSEELEPGEGWPYDRVLEMLSANPTMTGFELGPRIVELYVDSYRTGSVTQSAFDLGKLDDAAAAIDALARALVKSIKDATEYTAVAKTLNATQHFDTADFVDLGHFCQELAKRTKVAAVKAAATATADVLRTRGGFVLAERHRGDQRQQRERCGHLLPAWAGQQGLRQTGFRLGHQVAGVPGRLPQGIARGRARHDDVEGERDPRSPTRANRARARPEGGRSGHQGCRPGADGARRGATARPRRPGPRRYRGDRAPGRPADLEPGRGCAARSGATIAARPGRRHRADPVGADHRAHQPLVGRLGDQGIEGGRDRHRREDHRLRRRPCRRPAPARCGSLCLCRGQSRTLRAGDHARRQRPGAGLPPWHGVVDDGQLLGAVDGPGRQPDQRDLRPLRRPGARLSAQDAHREPD